MVTSATSRWGRPKNGSSVGTSLRRGRISLPLRDRFWHADWTLAHLADALPFVEQFYPIAIEHQKLMGPLVRFRWFRGISWDAAARYENGWVAFFWSGIMQGEAKLHDTFNRFPTDLDAVLHV